MLTYDLEKEVVFKVISPLQSPNVFIRGSKLTKRILEKINSLNSEYMMKSKPQGLEKFFLYDESAKSALKDIFEWIDGNHMQQPLFPNLVESPPRIGEASPRICLAITSARRVG